VGLTYFDSATSNSVVIAEVQDSTGQLLPSQNQVLYTNAFTGNGLQADTRYSYTRAGLEQDVILRTDLPSPTNWNLNPQTTLLQVWTEFTATPTPQIYSLTNSDDSPPDQLLNFGTMQMGPGKAFLLGDESELSPVFKQWQVIQGSTFLVESVPIDSVSSQLQNLPPPNSPDDSDPGSSGSSSSGSHSMLNHLSTRTSLLAQKRVSKPVSPILIASKQRNAKGLVLDYVTINSTQTNITFQSDTTYYVSSVVSSTGTNTFEGGTVIKFATNGLVGISSSTLNWNAGPYRPVVCTVKDDNSIGQPISGSSGNPTNYYYGYAMLELVSIPSPFTLNGLRMSYAQIGLLISSCQGSVYNAQFVNCGVGIWDGFATVLVANALFGNVQTNLVIQKDTTNNVENATFSGSSCLAKGPAAVLLCPLALTNCILANVTNLVAGSLTSTNGNYNSFYNCAEFGGNTLTNLSNPFQTAVAGNYYLVDSSTNRNVGTTNIDSMLLTDLRQKTTYPPSSLTVDFSDPKNESPYALRDNGTNVDLGYHYDPIDWALGGIEVVGPGSLVFQPGTVIAVYCNSNSDNTNFGFTVGSGGTFSCLGTANALCRIVNYNTVQEQSGTNWNTPYQGLIYANTSTSTNNYRFTDFSVMAQDTAFIYNTGGTTLPITLQDCQLHGGLLYSTNATINLLNCLLERVTATLWAQDGNAPQIRNNLFWYGNLDLMFTPTNTLIQNNLFDHNTNTDHSLTNYIGTYNGYVIGCDHLTLTNSTNDQFLTSSPTYQATAQGNYYLSGTGTNLINKGSTTADALGLYLYCTTTNELAETNSTVDIGYHYVALNPIGVPTNLDIVPDLLYYKMMEYIPTTLPVGLPAYTNYALNLSDSSTNGGATGFVTNIGANPVIWRSNQTGLYTGAVHTRETLITASDASRFNFTTDLFTVCLWLQPLISANQGCPTNTNTCGNIAILGNGTTNFSAGWWIVLGGSDNLAVIGANTTAGVAPPYFVASTGSAAASGGWTMLAFVRSNTSTVLIYQCNSFGFGQLATVGNFTNPVSSTNNLIFGQYNVDPTIAGRVIPYDGDFGVIRIYDYPLTSNQIYQIYTNGITGVVP